MCVALALAVGVAGCAGAEEGERSESRDARVIRVIDGDTVEMERLGRVRLIGVDTPEERRCYETEATRFTRDRLEGEVVRYELDVERTDRYGRTLAYLSRDGRMHNEALLSEGYARLLIVPPNDRHEQRLEEAQRAARRERTGLWKTCHRDTVRARRAAAERRRRKAAERREARRLRARLRRQARRERAAARRRERQAPEDSYAPPPDDGSSGGGGDSGGGGACLPPSACPGRRDGDGDGCYCE